MTESKSKRKSNIVVREASSVEDIREWFQNLLYVPDPRHKSKLVNVISNYLISKTSSTDYHQKIYGAYEYNGLVGMVVCQIDHHYLSYGRKCASFGWLIAPTFEICRVLMDCCEDFLSQHRIRKLRGPLNYPKSVGGIGIQVEGFEHQMIYGVAFGDPNSNVIEYLDALGYDKESEYTCMEVTAKTWKSGKTVDEDIRLEFRTLNGLVALKEEIFELAKNSFQMSFPDSFGKDERFEEMIESFKQVPATHYQLPENFSLPEGDSPEAFVEAWKKCNLEEIVSSFPLAFDRNSGKLVGLIICVLDMYQAWLGESITRGNVDTAMVDKTFAGKGIFSALNNIGQLTAGFHGITYFEGTGIWYNNKDAVNSIFPHCKHIRKHYVFQKRIKSIKS